MLFGEIIVINGDPVDINDGRFVTLRFHEEIIEEQSELEEKSE